jgi:hypothetical protein
MELEKLIWVAFCDSCGEIFKAPNGDFVNAYARKHKSTNKEHIVLLGTYVKGDT